MLLNKSIRFLTMYFLSLIVPIALLAIIFKIGTTQVLITTTENNSVDSLNSILIELSKNLNGPLVSLLIQIFIILVFSRICAFLLKQIGQPQVIGEMLAGILMGKSVLAELWPAGYQALFPDSSMPHLYFLSQIGLIFFMFVVGLDLKISDLKNKAQTAILISHFSIVFPFLLGAISALGLYKNFGPSQYSFTSFALFMGISMSITAFPVLARIIHERKMANSSLGIMALTCAAVDDITAWCLLAVVIGIVKAGSVIVASSVIFLSIIYILFMWKIAKPFLSAVLKPVSENGKFSRGQMVLVFSVVLGSALLTEIIGIHALFGAFLAGIIMPQSNILRSNLMEKINDLSSVLLLPIFFAYTGIRMQITLLSSLNLWLWSLLVLLLAVIGKLVGTALAAKWTGLSWNESWSLGALMNTRGLMELVVLNIGYEIGIITPTIFAIMVVMTFVTTSMTAPLLNFIERYK